LRKARFIAVVALAAALGIAAVAYAQNAYTNQYTVNGSVSASGGSKAKPKPGGLTFSFDTTEAAGNMPGPILKYRILFEGGKVNSSIIPGCKASTMSAAQSDKSCPTKSKIGGGLVKAKAGAAGGPLADAADCELGLTLYNSGGGKAALWLEGGPGTAHNCIAGIHEAIDAKWVKTADSSGLEFTVPEKLRHVAGLDVAVIHADSKINKITAKKKGKTVGFLESTGCKDKNRTISVIFTDEAGSAVSAKKDLGKC
jgi:hypothetical protein